MQRMGISTQKTPPGPLASSGLIPSMKRRVGPISRADARKSGSNAITGGMPVTVTGTWIVADFPSLSIHVSVSGPGRSQLKRTDGLRPVSDRSQAMSAARWVSGMVASARNSVGTTCQ